MKLSDSLLLVYRLEETATSVFGCRRFPDAEGAAEIDYSMSAFPDARYTVEDQIAEGDKVVVRWTLRATQSLEYQGHPPNDKTMTVTGISIFRLADGKIQEITVNMDRLGQMEQLGWRGWRKK